MPAGIFHFEGFIALDPTHALARAAGIGNGLTLSATGRTGLLNGEEPLLHAHGALTVTGATCFRARAGFGARTLAGIAGLPT